MDGGRLPTEELDYLSAIPLLGRRGTARDSEVVEQQKIFDGPHLNRAGSGAIKGAEVSLERESPAETYTAAEIVEAVKSLNTQHKTALMKLARAYAVKTSFDHEDLLQEACMRVLDGRREWPRSVGVIPFLAGVMRSIAWDWQVERHNESVEVNEVGYEDQTAAAKIDALKTVALFDDDPIAQKMVIALLDGARGEELRELSGLTKTEYESKRTKIRRRIEKAWA